MGNQIEKKTEPEMEAGFIRGEATGFSKGYGVCKVLVCIQLDSANALAWLYLMSPAQVWEPMMTPTSGFLVSTRLGGTKSRFPEGSTTGLRHSFYHGSPTARHSRSCGEAF